MGKKYYGDITPVTRSEFLQHQAAREFQQEWYPFCRNTMRQAWYTTFHAQRFEDAYDRGRYPNRRHSRCWKKYRKTQYYVRILQ